MKYFRISLLFVFSSVFVLQAFGVGTTGTIVGTVTDKSSAVVVNAKVTLRNSETNATRDTQTNARGEYSFALLPPGTYEITVEMSGFQKAIAKDVKLAVDQTARIDVALQIGSLSQQVVISEEAPLVQTETSTIGDVIDRKKISQLPLNERNFMSFTLLVPGAQLPSDGSQNLTQGGAVSVNGAREQSNNFLIDGVDNNDLAINQYSALPSVDAIEEFKVQSSTSSAEFGRSGGAQINVALKSGGNQYHGSVYEFVRNRHMDAKNFFDLPDCRASSAPGSCSKIPRLDRNQFGATLGGPIRKDKTFFFLSYEELLLHQASTRSATVASALETATALGAVPVAQRNAAGLAIFNLLPGPNSGTNQFVSAPSVQNKEYLASAKVDQRLGQKDSVSGHYVIFDENRFNPFDPLAPFTNLPGYGSFTINRGQNVRLTWTHTFNSKLANEARMGFNRIRGGIIQQHSGTDFNKQLGFPTVQPGKIDLGFPNVGLAGLDSVGEPTNTPQDRHDNTFHWVDNLVWNPSFNGGRHTLKFGADIRRFQLNFFLDAVARGLWQFNGGVSNAAMGNVSILEDLLRGTPSFFIGTTGNTVTALRTTEENFYAQDDIRVSTRLTLNLGLRYEHNGGPIDKYNQLFVPDFSANSVTCTPQPNCQFFRTGTHGIPSPGYSPSNKNFAPRLGFAWRPLSSDRLVIRAGYGIFWDAALLNGNILPRFNPPVFIQLFFPQNAMAPFTTISTINNPANSVPLVNPSFIDPKYKDGYLQDYNVDLQYEVFHNTLLDFAYVASKGTHLVNQRDFNQMPPGGVRPFPQFAGTTILESQANSTYQSLQFRGERRLTHGLTFLTAYTFSRSIDDSSALFGTRAEPGLAQNSRNLSGERGLSNFQAKHRLVFSHLYQLPFGKGHRWLNEEGWVNGIFGNWQAGGIWTFQSGRPFTVTSAIPLSGASTDLGVVDRPNIIADPFLAGPVPGNPLCNAPSKVRTPANWFNPCAFVGQTSGFGNEGRNALIGPTYKNVDFSLLKDVPFSNERYRIQFRAEFFNVANHPNFEIPNNTFNGCNPLPSTPPNPPPPGCTTGALGLLTSSNAYGNRPPRQIQLGLRFSF